MERLTDDRFLKDGFYQPKSKEEAKEIRYMSSDLTFEKLYKHCAEVEKENAELQKQVDELKKSQANKYALEAIYNNGYEHAVKDTAKEILDDLRNIFIEQSSYGCDANQHVGYYEYGVKISLVIEQIEEYAKEKYNIEYGVEVE